jgi:IS5 family transposase
MVSEHGQQIYRRRKHIERTHAQMKNRGLARLPVRGLEPVRAVALLHAITNNLWRAHSLRTVA